MPPADRHLDLGCGKFPRNPYGRSEVCGIDVRALESAGFEQRVADLAVAPIPWPDASFASVSAYDFLEHVPRILATADGSGTFFPFVRLMQEIWRVLVPGGRLYALTPAYPHAEAFTDPTHVNILTAHSHEYFCGERALARMYGFGGHFRALRVEWVRVQDVYSAQAGSPENRAPYPPLKRIARGWRHFTRVLRGKPDASFPPKAYLLWELEAVKPAPEAHR
ncbi:MAG: methyltransferase domain-containing protein [Proteobacteria bacterium]|nr:methyltransferase domain-containing protein [Pseudomonadota bacterium]